MGYSTLSAYKRQVKANLAAALAGYGLQATHGNPKTLSPTDPQPAQSAGLVTTRLFEAVHDTSEYVVYPSIVPPITQQSAEVNGYRKPIEKRQQLPETYPTGWGGALTLEQIVTDPVVRRAAFAKAGRLGLNTDDQEDCVQQGFIRLWQKLCDDPQLLVDKGPLWVGIYIAYSGNPKQFQRHYNRQQSFTNPAFDWQAADEYLPIGLQSDNRPNQALWTTEVDETLDVNRFLRAMSQQYANHPRKLVALQAVTGTLSAQEAARQLGMHQKKLCGRDR